MEIEASAKLKILKLQYLVNPKIINKNNKFYIITPHIQKGEQIIKERCSRKVTRSHGYTNDGTEYFYINPAYVHQAKGCYIYNLITDGEMSDEFFQLLFYSCSYGLCSLEIID